MPWAERRQRTAARAFPTQRKLHSPLSPNFFEKQFSDGNEKNNMSIVGLEITSLYKLEKQKGKRAEIQNRRSWVLLKVPPRRSLLKGSCPFQQKSPGLAKPWKAQIPSLKVLFFSGN